MKRVAVLRSNPKDSAFVKILMVLSKQYGVDCYLWDRQGDYVPFFRKENVAYHACRTRGAYYSVFTLWKVLLFNLWLLVKLFGANFQYVHAIDLDTGIVGWIMARFRRKPFVYQCLDPYYANLPPGWPKILGGITKWVENRLISSADLFVITDRLRMPQHAGASPRAVLEYPNVPPVDVAEVREDFRKRTERGTGEETGKELTVGYIGSLIEGRNLLTIIDAAGELDGEGIRLVIGGFGPLEKEVAKKAGEYRNISFVGWVPYADVLEMERTFDVFVHTTDPENESQKWVSPAKLFESMALGKPIVVSEATLAAERVKRAGCGVAVRYGSKSDLQDVILRFRKDEAAVRELGAKGKEEYSRAWSWGIMERRLLDAYRSVPESQGRNRE